jgi:hypothetical protein
VRSHFSARSAFVDAIELRLELCNLILSGVKLVREPLCSIEHLFAVLLGDIGSFIQELKYRLTGPLSS